MRGKLPTEVFTPDSIIKLLTFRYIDDILNIDNYTVCDPACGTGNIILYILNYALKSGKDVKKIYNKLYGYEINKRNLDLFKSRLDEILPDLSDQDFESHFKCKNTLEISTIKNYDLIIMNPPYEKDLHKKFLIWAINNAKKYHQFSQVKFYIINI